MLKARFSKFKQAHKYQSSRLKRSLNNLVKIEVREIERMSTSTATVQRFVEANNSYASSFDKGDLALPPAKQYLILTCMDARIDAPRAFGRDLGDAHIVQNAGASAKDALRSLVISQQLLGTKEIILIKHTDCGMLTFSNDDIYSVIKKNLNQDASHIDFLPFPELEQAVRDDVQFLKESKLIPEGINISGWIYDVKTGKVKHIV